MIWLLNPPFEEMVFREGRCEQKVGVFQTSYPPLTLAYLASILRKKFEVRLLDAIGEHRDLDYIKNLFEKDKPDIIFMSVSTPTIQSDLKIIEELSKIKESKFYIFGIHASYFNERLTKKNIIAIKGEPEKVAFSLIGEKNDLSNLDDLPFPAWDLVNFKLYSVPLIRNKFALMQPSRGCPFGCVFCTNPFFYNKKVRIRSVDSVIKEMKYVKSLGLNNVIFFSDTFTLYKDWVNELCNKMIEEKLNIKWVCNSRVDTVDRETLFLMRKAGCWLMSFGIESGDQGILDGVKKQIKIEDIKRTVKDANDSGILTFGHFILGLPGETKETLNKTIKFSRGLDLDFVMFYIATPLPGSEIYEGYKGKIEENWKNFEYSSQVLNKELDLEEAQRKALRGFYMNNLKPRKAVKLLRAVGYKNWFNVALSGFGLLRSLRA